MEIYTGEKTRLSRVIQKKRKNGSKQPPVGEIIENYCGRRFSGNQVPVRVGKSPVIQCAVNFNNARLPVPLQVPLGQEIQALNVALQSKRKSRKRVLHAQFAQIDTIERRINAYISANDAQITDQERTELFAILRQTEAEHIRLAGILASRGHDIWIGDNTLKQPQKDQVQQVWHSLRANQGNLELQTVNEDFKNEVLSGYIRLLNGAHGRTLLTELNAPQADPDRKIIVSDDHSQNYARAGQTAGAGSWAASIGKIRHGDTNAENGTGTGSYVQIQPSVPVGWGDYESSRQGKPLFNNKFITLAHELGHARHNLQGRTENSAWFDLPQAHPLHDDLVGMAKWSNPEEYGNIMTEENPIRREQGLPEREFHATIDSARAQENRILLDNRLDAIFNALPKYLQGEVGKQFGAVNMEIQQTDLSIEAHAIALRQKVEALNSLYLGKRAWHFIKEHKKKLLGAVGGLALAAGGAVAWKMFQK